MLAGGRPDDKAVRVTVVTEPEYTCRAGTDGMRQDLQGQDAETMKPPGGGFILANA